MLRRALEKRIREHKHDFDLPALLELLARNGYRREDIEFRSHRTQVHQGHLVHDVEFKHSKPIRHFVRKPPRYILHARREVFFHALREQTLHVARTRVIITVNVGLLSVQSLLPSFMLQALERVHHERLERFLGYFDHVLLQQRFAGLFPEREEGLLPRWDVTTEHRLRMLRPTCPSTLHWLFSHVFPEAEVRVRRELRRQPVPTLGIRLGTTTLGGPAAMGGFALVPTGGVEVFICCDESISASGRPWAREAPRRLKTLLLPQLAGLTLLLTVVLELRDVTDWAHIDGDLDGDGAIDESYLGYAPIQGGPDSPRRIVLFSGDTARYHPPAPRQPPAPRPRKAA